MVFYDRMTALLQFLVCYLGVWDLVFQSGVFSRESGLFHTFSIRNSAFDFKY